MTDEDIIKIGTTNVVIHRNNEGPMIFGKSAKKNEEEDIGATNKAVNPKYSMPRWCPSGLTWFQKRKLQHLRIMESREEEAEKIFNDTHP
jgi:ribosomal protein S2